MPASAKDSANSGNETLIRADVDSLPDESQVRFTLFCQGITHVYTHACMHACMHAHTHMYPHVQVITYFMLALKKVHVPYMVVNVNIPQTESGSTSRLYSIFHVN